MTAAEMTTWEAMCSYKCRIAEEAFRFNTVSLPPPSHVWNETTAIGERLGRPLVFLSMLIPERVARKWSDR